MTVAIAILGTAIALAGVVIAMAQLAIARATFAHSLFERRYAIYAAARKLISEVCSHANVSDTEIFAFVRASHDSVFILDDTVTTYMKELKDKAFRVMLLREIVSTGQPADQINSAIHESYDLVLWFTNQFDVLTDKFKPFLKLKKGLFSWLQSN